MTIREEKCRDCRFYEPTDVSSGFCLRYPPVLPREPDPGGDYDGWPMSPTVAAFEWCGEWKVTR